MAESKSRVALQFNEYDFRHRKVLEILRSHKRHMSDMVVNAVLHYISCPEVETEISKETIRSVVKEVITDMVADGSFSAVGSGISHPSQPSAEEIFELGDMMSAFRKRGAFMDK